MTNEETKAASNGTSCCGVIRTFEIAMKARKLDYEKAYSKLGGIAYKKAVKDAFKDRVKTRLVRSGAAEGDAEDVPTFQIGDMVAFLDGAEMPDIEGFLFDWCMATGRIWDGFGEGVVLHDDLADCDGLGDCAALCFENGAFYEDNGEDIPEIAEEWHDSRAEEEELAYARRHPY